MGKKYKLELTENQLRTIATGLEFYSRFLAGQWEIPSAMQWKEYVIQGNPEDFWNIRNESLELLGNAKRLFLSHINGYYAIGSDLLHEDAKISYDIYRPILEKFTQESMGNCPNELPLSVYAYEGLTYSKEGRIKVERIK